jgi:hypothetical protein
MHRQPPAKALQTAHPPQDCCGAIVDDLNVARLDSEPSHRQSIPVRTRATPDSLVFGRAPCGPSKLALQHCASVSRKRTLFAAAAFARGPISSGCASSRCSSRHVAIAARRSACACTPQRRANAHTSSGCDSMNPPMRMIACQRGSRSPSGAGRPGKIASARAIARRTAACLRRVDARSLMLRDTLERLRRDDETWNISYEGRGAMGKTCGAFDVDLHEGPRRHRSYPCSAAHGPQARVKTCRTDVREQAQRHGRTSLPVRNRF